MRNNSLKIESFHTNKLLCGVHASTQIKNCNSFIGENSITADDNGRKNDTVDCVELITSINKRCGRGNFASLFANKNDSTATPPINKSNIDAHTCNFNKAYNNESIILETEEINQINSYFITESSRPNSFTNEIDNETDDNGTLKSICKVLTLTNSDNSNDEFLLKRMPNKKFTESIMGSKESIFIETSETSEFSKSGKSSIEIKDNASDTTSIDNEQDSEKFERDQFQPLGKDMFKYINSATSKFDQLLSEFTSPTTKATKQSNLIIEKLLKVISERDEEIVELRQENAQLNNYIKQIPTKGTLVQQIRAEMLSAIDVNNAELKTVKAENNALKLRMLDMEALQFEKDKRIRQLVGEKMQIELEKYGLDRKLKSMELKLGNEKVEKMELSIQSLKNEKEERIRGRNEWCSKLELEKFDKMQIEKVSNDRLEKIEKLEQSLNGMQKMLKSSKENENKLEQIIQSKQEELDRCNGEITELKSLLVVSKTNISLVNTYQAKLEDLSYQLDKEKMFNHKDQVLKSLVDEQLNNVPKLDSVFKSKIDVIVDKIRSTGKGVQVDWICDNMFKVQGKIVQLKLVGDKVCALRNTTPFPLELLLLN